MKAIRCSRDSAYHQGTVWPWLLGPFVSAYLGVHGRNAQTLDKVRGWLAEFARYIEDEGLGQIRKFSTATRRIGRRLYRAGLERGGNAARSRGSGCVSGVQRNKGRSLLNLNLHHPRCVAIEYLPLRLFIRRRACGWPR